MKNMRLSPAIAIGLILGILVPSIIAGWVATENQSRLLTRQLTDYHSRITRLVALSMR